MSKLKYIILCILLFITAAFLFGTKGAEREKIAVSDKELLISSEVSDISIYSSDSKIKKMKKIGASGVLEMYLDEKTLAVCILDTISGKLWRSLPEDAGGIKSANLIAHVIIRGGEYSLNSQSDSLGLGCASYEIKDDSLILLYSFRKSLENGKKIDLTVPLELKFSDGNLSVKTDCSKIKDNSTVKVYIKSLSLLPFFGAGNSTCEGDFILLPSSSGIILDTHKETDKAKEIVLPVYGEDIAKNKGASSFVPIGAFGIKSADSAFLCLTSEGEAIAAIKAKKADKKYPCNQVGAEFEITSCLSEDSAVYISKSPYEGEIGLIYRFLSGNNADYITMAGACRELLIRQGVLTDSNLSDNEYPFNLTLIGSTPEKGTTTSDGEFSELISSLITKGINNINVILKDSEERDISVLSSITSKNSLSLSLMKNIFPAEGKTAVTLSGEENSMGLSIEKTEKNTKEIINYMRKYSVGVCLSDCGFVLPSDYRKFGVKERCDIISDVSQLCTAISSHGALSVSGANIYAVKYAENIINIPEKSPLEDEAYCTSVPFLEAVLHGICDYSFTALNLSGDPTKAMLRAIEYGALPHYEWYFAEYEEEDPLSYMNSLSQARLLYENMKKMFSDLREQRIISHEEVKTDVFCTVYSGGSEIYVNYSDSAVTVSGITVDPSGFLRVN